MKNIKKEFLKKKRILIPAIAIVSAFVASLLGADINEQNLEELLNAVSNLIQ